MHFSFDFVWYTTSILMLSVKFRGGGGFLLNGHNPLSVTKVICKQSLSHINKQVHAICTTRLIWLLLGCPNLQIWFVQFIAHQARLFKSFKIENGSRISDKKLVILEFKYIQDKKMAEKSYKKQ